ncbi:MAG: thrombospondin type 3 repeat-containing protein [Myxococcota bacterium]
MIRTQRRSPTTILENVFLERATWSWSVLVFMATMFFHVTAHAHPVGIDPDVYDGEWRLDGGPTTIGAQTLDVAEGAHLMRVAAHGIFSFNVDAAGVVTVDNGISAVGGAGSLTFNTVVTAVDPGDFDGQWQISRGDPAVYAAGARTAVLVPGVFFNVRVGSVGSFAVSTDGAGNVLVDNGVSAVGGPATLTFNTFDVAVDPGAFGGQWFISRGEPAAYSTGPATATFVPGVFFNIRVGGIGAFVASVDEFGEVDVANGISATGGTQSMTFNTVSGTVDPAAFDGTWFVSRGVPAAATVGPAATTFVTGVQFNVRVGNQGSFVASANSAGAFEVSNGISGIGGAGITFNTVDVAVDPADFSGDWYILGGEPGAPLMGTSSATFVPAVNFAVRVGTVGTFHLVTESDGTVEVFNGVSANGGLGTLDFNTSAISVDPQAFAGQWRINSVVDFTTGPATVNLVPATSYTFAATGQGSGQPFTVEDPCDVTPGSLDFGGNLFLFECGCPDGDVDGVCDADDACPLDPDNDADGDGVCGDVDVCSGDDATGDSDGDGLCDDIDACVGDNATGDTDLDGVCNDQDQCSGNDGTGDTDSDGICDSDDQCLGDDTTGDSDGDLVCDDLDVCEGDDASGDSDDDLVCDDSDVCPLDPLDDEDGDGVCGDVDSCLGDDATGDDDFDDICNDQDLCLGNDATGDEDVDGVCDDIDNCPIDPNDDQADGDGDGVGDLCEADGDGDGVIDDLDNCPDTANDDQSDIDGDGDGDPCDDDDDGDGVLDSADNCPIYANADQLDFDGDGSGDVCDGDDDADGVGDDLDACPQTPLNVLFDRRGCSGMQLVDLRCGDPSDYWRPWSYLRCVTRASKRAQRKGLLTRRQRARIVRAAARWLRGWRWAC